MIQQQHRDFAASAALLAEFEKGNIFKISSVDVSCIKAKTIFKKYWYANIMGVLIVYQINRLLFLK